MGVYLARRLGWLLLVLLAVLTISFALIQAIPGDVAVFYAGPHASAQVLAETRHALGLDQPKELQYLRYLWRTLHGDLGQSVTMDEPVLTAILQRLQATTLLAGAVIGLELGLALLFGTLATRYDGGPLDRLVAALAALGVALPNFVIGILLLYLVAFRLNLLPLGGYCDPVWLYLILPAATLGVPDGFWYARILKVTLAGTMHEDYLRTARAKGLAKRTTVVRHALPNAILPVLTIVAMDLGQLLGGVVVVESVFTWPGIGQLAFRALQALDAPLAMGIVLFTALCITLLNLVADLLRLVIDPRVRVG